MACLSEYRNVAPVRVEYFESPTGKIQQMKCGTTVESSGILHALVRWTQHLASRNLPSQGDVNAIMSFVGGQGYVAVIANHQACINIEIRVVLYAPF